MLFKKSLQQSASACVKFCRMEMAPVLRTKLVEFVMDFVENQNFVVIRTVAFDDFVDDVDF